MHGDAVVARRFHCYIDVNASPRPFRFCAVPIVMKTKIVHFGSLACDSHSLGDHVLVYCPAVVPGKHNPVNVCYDRPPPFLLLDLIENFNNPIG